LAADQVIVDDATMVRLVVRSDFVCEMSDPAEFKPELLTSTTKRQL
jgi:hypothetical protein